MKLYNFTVSLILMATIASFNKAEGQQQKIVIDVDFPGGNIIVDHNENNSTLYYVITTDTVLLQSDIRDTKGNWFYWYFRISGAANKTLHFQFPRPLFGSFGPAFSNDGGKSWQWLYKELHDTYDHFSYTFGSSENEVMFSSTIPYLQSDFDKFISFYKNNPYVSVGSLTTSEKGRKVEKVNIIRTNVKPKYKVLLTARHHAGEAMASYVLEGLISAILDNDDNSTKWLRENVEFLIIPFMDKDGVEDGDQGKNRRPRDHEQDYSGKSLYKSTASIRQFVPGWSEGKLKVVLDLHCPGIVGEWHEHIYFVGEKDEKIANMQKVFIDTLERCQRGELILNQKKPILKYGVSWNVDTPGIQEIGFSQWASAIEGVSLSACWEIPFTNNDGQMVTPQNARLFGKDLAIAISEYIRGLLQH